MTTQELLPEQLQTPPRVVTDRTPAAARAAPLSLAPSGLAADEEEALARVSDPTPTDVEVRRGRPCRCGQLRQTSSTAYTFRAQTPEANSQSQSDPGKLPDDPCLHFHIDKMLLTP